MPGKPRGINGIAALLLAALALSLPRTVQADDDLVLMREPASFVDVVDAFDDRDPFDLNITIGYVRSMEIGRVQREPGSGDPEGRMSREWQDVADYTREVNQLVFGLDIGIFRDLAIYGRLPVVLSDDRALSSIGGTGTTTIFDRAPTPSALFDVPFRSPTRSGLDWISAGLAWAVLNQQRDPHVPNWVLMLEGRFNLDEPMHACRHEGADVVCQGGGGPGISRGTNALRVETRGSFRYQYVEPYAGLAFQMEFPGNADRLFTQGGNLAGYINQRPPIQGRLTAGMAIVPWEDRQQWQRFSIDLRFTGDYISEGREYSPLFDALGTSQDPYLASPNCEGVDPSGACGRDVGLEQVAFTGLTDTQAHVRIGGQLMLEMQAARYVRFSLLTAIFHSPSYGITQADACNPNASSTDERRFGTCRSGIINPHHRPVIDLPGQRFRMESLTQIDVAAYVTAQF